MPDTNPQSFDKEFNDAMAITSQDLNGKLQVPKVQWPPVRTITLNEYRKLVDKGEAGPERPEQAEKPSPKKAIKKGPRQRTTSPSGSTPTTPIVAPSAQAVGPETPNPTAGPAKPATPSPDTLQEFESRMNRIEDGMEQIIQRLRLALTQPVQPTPAAANPPWPRPTQALPPKAVTGVEEGTMESEDDSTGQDSKPPDCEPPDSDGTVEKGSNFEDRVQSVTSKVLAHIAQRDPIQLWRKLCWRNNTARWDAYPTWGSVAESINRYVGGDNTKDVVAHCLFIADDGGASMTIERIAMHVISAAGWDAFRKEGWKFRLAADTEGS